VDDTPPYQEGERILSGTLYRRFPNREHYFHVDRGTATRLAFMPDSGEPYTSMALASLTSPAEVLKQHPDFGLSKVEIEHFPDGVTATYEPAYGHDHVGVWGLDGSEGEARRKALARRAKLVQPPKLPLLPFKSG
jgi:hypothetical protein